MVDTFLCLSDLCLAAYVIKWNALCTLNSLSRGYLKYKESGGKHYVFCSRVSHIELPPSNKKIPLINEPNLINEEPTNRSSTKLSLQRDYADRHVKYPCILST
jgi:hypothetical protein